MSKNTDLAQTFLQDARDAIGRESSDADTMEEIDALGNIQLQINQAEDMIKGYSND